MKSHTNNLPPHWPVESRPHRRCVAGAVVGGARLWTLLLLLAACPLLASDAPALNLPGTAQPAANSLTENAAKPSARALDASRLEAAGGVNVQDDKHQLAIGDQISYRIVEDEGDPRILMVTDSGELEVPCIGRLHVVGKTCKELTLQIKTELEKDYYYQATVIIAVNVMAKSRGRCT